MKFHIPDIREKPVFYTNGRIAFMSHNRHVALCGYLGNDNRIMRNSTSVRSDKVCQHCMKKIKEIYKGKLL